MPIDSKVTLDRNEPFISRIVAWEIPEVVGEAFALVDVEVWGEIKK